MKQYIQKLHARPSHEKRRYSMRAAAVAIAIIFLVWIMTLGIRLQGMAGGTASTAGDTSSLSAMTAAVGSDISEKFGQIQSSFGGAEGTSAAQVSSGSDNNTPLPSAAPATVLQPPAGAGASAGAGSN